MLSLKEIRKDQNHWVGTCGPLVVLYWYGAVEPEVCRSLPGIARLLAGSQPDRRVAVLSVALPGVASPSVEARKALANLIRDTDQMVSRVAVVLESRGFTASILSSVATGIAMLARPSHPHRAFSTYLDAVRWSAQGLADFTEERLRVEDAVTVITEQARGLVPSARVGLGLAPNP